MAESFNLLRRVRSLDIAPELSGYSGVVIFAGQDDDGNNIEYRAGDQTGTVLEITNEWGSQAQADAIYKKISGYKYQPYKASGSSIDPSVELCDAVTVSDIYGGVFSKSTTYGKHVVTDLEAPSKEEVEHEFQVQSPTNRQYERFTRTVRASLSITASKIAAEVEERQKQDGLLRATLNIHAKEISAKVSSEVGNTSSNFWWKLISTGWSVGTGSKTVFSVKSTGAYVDGEIRASSGKIGNWDINSNSLSYNGQTWGGTNTTGAYIGQSGIQLGKNFKVDMQGNLTATGGIFDGTVKCRSLVVDGQTISPASVRSGIGGGNSYNSSGWGNYSASTVAGNAANGNTALRVLDGTQYMSTINLRSGTFQMNGYNVYLGTIMVNGTQLKVLRWA